MSTKADATQTFMPFGTLSTLGYRQTVCLREWQELMRHSDRRLTDQVYLDTSLLPLQECMRSIDGFGPWTQIWTHFSGKTCHLGSRVGEVGEEGEIAGLPLTVGSGRSLTQPVGRCANGGIDGTRTRKSSDVVSQKKGFRH